MQSKLKTILFLLFCLLGTAWLGCTEAPPRSGSVSEPDPDYVPPEGRLTEFEFTDQLGKPFHSKALDGKVWLGSFFFADCPSICVQQNTQIAKLHKRFADEGVMIVEMTVAPDKDPAPKLWTYAERFDADHTSWKFLTGKEIEYVRRVGEDMFALPAADETHTSDVVIFGRDGRMYDAYNVMDDQEFAKCVDKVTLLLAEEYEPKSDATPVDAAPQPNESEDTEVSSNS